MKNLHKLLILFLFILIIFILPTDIYSASNIGINIKSTYRVGLAGEVNVTYEIDIVNLKSEVYTKQYSLDLLSIKPRDITVIYNDKNINYDLYTNGTNSKINIAFEDDVVGKDKFRKIFINFKEDYIAVKSGNIWEISIPKILDISQINNYNCDIYIPKLLGDEAYISPYTKRIENDSFYIYSYSNTDLIKDGISIGLGKYQVYSFSIKYNLKNDNFKTDYKSIALPPDTSYQRVYFSEIIPKPNEIKLDSDGNWMAYYKLGPKSSLNIKTSGQIKVFSNPFKFLTTPPSSLLENTKVDEYWNFDSQEIIDVSKNLNNIQEIYKFVVNYLKYNPDRLDNYRKGAQLALKEPDDSICSEFTDLFITIARSKGIPAREINGYAYTDNPEINPLSLKKDILHAWPEYWDSNKNIWIQVDPTWENTSQLDYFSSFDLKHITFVIHGANSSFPNPPGFKNDSKKIEKDIKINIGEIKNNFNLPLNVIMDNSIINVLHNKFIVKVENTNPNAQYKIPLDIYFDDNFERSEIIQYLPPLIITNVDINIPFSLFGIRTPKIINLNLQNQIYETETYFKRVFYAHIMFSSSILLTILIFILLKFKKSSF